MIQPFLIFSTWGLFVLRVALGCVLITRAWPSVKLFKKGMTWKTILSFLEFICGIFLVVGFFTQLAGTIIVIEFFILMLLRIKNDARFIAGFEHELIMLTGALVLATSSGYFAFGLDRYLGIILY